MPSETPRTDAFIAGRDPVRLSAEVGESTELSIAIGKAIRNLMVDYAEAQKDAERFRWWFSWGPKPNNFVAQYLNGMREHWDIEQWRACIDAARGERT